MVFSIHNIRNRFAKSKVVHEIKRMSEESIQTHLLTTGDNLYHLPHLPFNKSPINATHTEWKSFSSFNIQSLECTASHLNANEFQLVHN